MKKKILRAISFCLLTAALLSTAAFAAMDANKYILGTNVSIGMDAKGVVEVDCTVTATDSYPDVGIDELKIYQVGKTDPVATYTYTSRPSLMGHNKVSHSAAVTYNGKTTNQYYAKVSFYAGQIGVAGGGHTMTSKVVP